MNFEGNAPFLPLNPYFDTASTGNFIELTPRLCQ